MGFFYSVVTWGRGATCQYLTQSIPLSANVAPPIAYIVDTSGNHDDHAVRFGYRSQGVLPFNCPKGSAEVRISNIGIDPLVIGNITWGQGILSGLKLLEDRCSGKKLQQSSGPCSMQLVWDDFPWARGSTSLICPDGARARCYPKDSRTAGGKAVLLVPTNDPTQREPIEIEISTPKASCIKMVNCRCPIPLIPRIDQIPDFGGIPLPCPRPPCSSPGSTSPPCLQPPCTGPISP